MKPYFNDHQQLYSGREPPFYSAGVTEAVAMLEENFDTIGREFFSVYSCPDKRQEMFRKYTLKKQCGWQQSELKICGLSIRSALKREKDFLEALVKRDNDYSTVLLNSLLRN